MKRRYKKHEVNVGNESLIPQDLASTALCQLREVKMFCDPDFMAYAADIVDLIKQHFLIHYTKLRDYINKIFSAHKHPFAKIYEILSDVMLAAGISSMSQHINVVEVNNKSKMTQYVWDRDRAKNLLRNFAGKSFDGMTPLSIAANLYRPVQNHQAFAFRLGSSVLPAQFQLNEALYKEKMHELYTAEFTLYGDGIEIYPVAEKGNKKIMLIYSTKHTKTVNNFFKEHGTDFIKRCESFLRNVVKKWVAEKLELLKIKAADKEFRKWARFFIKLFRDLYDKIHSQMF